jgi:hypothetical protein
MKKKILLKLILFLLVFASIHTNGQTFNGKKASLNKEGNIKIENILLPVSNKEMTNSYEMLPGFPIGEPANPSFKNFRGAAIADLNGDSAQEIIFGAYNKLFAVKGNGEILWSKEVIGTIIYPPGIADINHDGNLEIVVNTRAIPNAGRVYLLDSQGNDLTGWPKNFDDHGMFNSPAISDINNNGFMEIVTCERATSTSNFLHVIKIDGNPLNNNWPVELPGPLAFTPSIGDIDANDTIDIVCSISAALYAINIDGNVMDGFPLADTNKKFSYQSPILADINGDEKLDIIGSRHGDSADYYVVKSDGTYMNGWPIASEGWRYSPPTVVDSDNDGKYEIYVGHPNVDFYGIPLNVIYGFTPQGTSLPGFPIKKYGGCEGVISVADINNDGIMDIIFTSNISDSLYNGYIHAYSLDGSGELSGFPLRTRGLTFLSSALLGDINNDGMLDLATLSYTQFTSNDSIFLSAYNLGVPYNKNKILFNGYKGNNLRDGLLKNFGMGISQIDKTENKILQIYPNPVTNNSIIIFNLSESSNVKLSVYNINGQLINSLIDENMDKGIHQFNWSATDNSEKKLNAGIYLMKLQTNNSVKSLKIIVN